MNAPSEKLGRVRLAPGVTRRAMATFYFAAIFSTCLMAFMNFAQPFVLNEVVHVPASEQGAASGLLGTLSEVVIIAFIGAAGVWSDRVGRRPIYAAGFVVLAAAYVAYPFATSLAQLVGLRMVFAVGAAAVSAMLATVVADYPIEDDRGKAAGTMGVMNGVGIMIALLLLAKLPAMLAKRGLEPLVAGRVAYAMTAGLCLVVAAVIARGLIKGAPVAEARRPLGELAREALAAAKDPSIALAYGAAFVSRGDLAVVGTFLTLWVSQHGAERGMDGARALAVAGSVMAVSQGAAFVWAPVIGVLADRWNRVSVLALALALAAIGYSSMAFVKDPTGRGMLLGACVIGIGEISALIASQVLIGAKAPRHARG
jgi:MFS family permease